MPYMTYYNGSYVAKNQLEKAQEKLCEQLNRHYLSTVEELRDFQQSMLDSLQELNAQHPRCKPFKPRWVKNGHVHNDYILLDIRVVDFRIYEIKGSW